MIFPGSMISEGLANDLCKQITRKVIRNLQQMNTSEYILSGDDSVLANTWDEVCVQIQLEQSMVWHAYELTIDTFVSYIVSELKSYEKMAIWIQTDEGSEWLYEDEDLRDNEPVVLDSEIVNYIIKDYIYEAAENWSNKRIYAYINGDY